MTKVLIADAGKASLVMSSEVFKDKIPGSIVHVARTGADVFTMLKEVQPEMCVVDFDLPDVDGVTLINEMRRVFNGPILLTAYPDSIVKMAVDEHLFAYDDAGGWLPKPIRTEALASKIDKFLIGKHRVWHRFDSEFAAQLVGKGAGRGKRAPKAAGSAINLSLEGACVRLAAALPVKAKEEVTITMQVPVVQDSAKVAQVAKKAAPAAKAKPSAKSSRSSGMCEMTIKGRVCWLSHGGRMAGLHFDRMTDAQRRGMETLLRQLAKDKPAEKAA
jgi:CheY-like chemotaxis protein